MANDFIEEYQVKDDTLCDDIIAYFHAHPELQKIVGGKGEAIRSAKRSTDLALKKGQHDELMLRYIAHLKAPVEEYMSVYPHSSSNLGVVEPLYIRKYEPGEGYYAYHWEGSHVKARHRFLVFQTFLNDVEDGGGTHFLYQDATKAAKKGKTLVWPCEFTHTHKGVVSETETKYIITGWLSWLPEDSEAK